MSFLLIIKYNCIEAKIQQFVEAEGKEHSEIPYSNMVKFITKYTQHKKHDHYLFMGKNISLTFLYQRCWFKILDRIVSIFKL